MPAPARSLRWNARSSPSPRCASDAAEQDRSPTMTKSVLMDPSFILPNVVYAMCRPECTKRCRGSLFPFRGTTSGPPLHHLYRPPRLPVESGQDLVDERADPVDLPHLPELD